MKYDPYVYIVRHELPLPEGEESPDAWVNGIIDRSAMIPFIEIEERLRESLEQRAEVLFGPYWKEGSMICHDLLIAACDQNVINDVLQFEGPSLRQATGEIFETSDHAYYAQARELTRLEGEVLSAWYHGQHGRKAPDLDTDLRRRLRRGCRLECRSLGYNNRAIRQITPAYIVAVFQRHPREWTFDFLHEELIQITDQYEANLRSGATWFAFEQMENAGVSLFPPMEDGQLILEVVEELYDDESTGTRQWLVRARPLFSSVRLRVPEFENVRGLEEGEVFSSRRGVIVILDGQGVWLGELAGDLLDDRHGQVVDDPEEIVREHVVEVILKRIRTCSPGVYEKDSLLDVIHELLDENDPLQLWFHDLQGLVEQVISAVGAAEH